MEILEILNVATCVKGLMPFFLSPMSQLHAVAVTSQVWHTVSLFYFNSRSEIIFINVQVIMFYPTSNNF